MKKRTLRVLIVIGVLISIFLYFYIGLIHIGNVKGLVQELDNQSVLQDYFAEEKDSLLQANFNENIERKILENSKYKSLKNEVFLVKTNEDYVAVGLKVDSKIKKYLLKQIFNQHFFKDSSRGDFMVLEEYRSRWIPLTVTYKRFGSTENHTNDSTTKEITRLVSEQQSDFNTSSYFFYDKFLWAQLRFNKENNNYQFSIDTNPSSYLKKELLFKEHLDSVQIKYFEDLKNSLSPTLEENRINMVLFKVFVPYYSPVPPPNQ